MNRPNTANVPASIRAKLLNKSKATNRPFLELLTYYSIERFLYRLSVSSYAQKFFLKGALMFKVWEAIDHRPTMDIDLLGKTPNTIENLENICRMICKQNISPDDGILFFPDTVRGKVIQTEAEYEGIRLEFEGDLNKAVLHMQIDIGFGDIIYPEPQILSYPTILNLPAPRLHGYTPESVIAEKLEAMIKRGMLNSRMKDFFDIWFLSKQFPFNSTILGNAIKTTFSRRGTILRSSPECFSEQFFSASSKNSQWQSFIRKNSLNAASEPLETVVKQITAFLQPVLYGIETDDIPDLKWEPSHKWSR